MEKQIIIFNVEVVDKQTILMPKGAEILTIQTTFDFPKLWALVDQLDILEERVFETFKTGCIVNCGNGIIRKYISTYQLLDGNYVFHVFELIKT